MPGNRASSNSTSRDTAISNTAQALGLVLPVANDPASQLAARFDSFANTIQTRLDGATAVGATLGGSLEAQVERALAQVMRQPSTTASLTAPAGAPGSVATLTGGLGGRTPAMAPAQAALVRETAIVQGDLLNILDAIQPMSILVDAGDLAALRALLRAEVNLLGQEFARTNLAPRQERVRVLFSGLVGWNAPGQTAPRSDVGDFVSLLNLGGPLVPTLQLDEQLACQQILVADAQQLLSQWNAYWLTSLAYAKGITWPVWEQINQTPPTGGLGTLSPQTLSPPNFVAAPGPGEWSVALAVGPATVTSRSVAERLIQADILIPVIAAGADRVSAALDAIGLTLGEQESVLTLLFTGADGALAPGSSVPQPSSAPLTGRPTYPVYTSITDVLEWARSLADAPSLDLLRQAGALGINLLADQADALVWLMLAMLDQSAQTPPIAELSDTQVQLELLSLTRDLSALAALAY